MTKQSQIGPFAYLRELVQADIAEARAARIALQRPVGGLPTAVGSRSPSAKDEEMLQPGYPAVWGERVAALQHIARLSRLPRDWILPAYQLAFDDPDARVRGAAWLELAAASRDPQNLPELIASTILAFIERFHAPSEHHQQLEPGARHWLHELSQELDRPARERAAAKARQDYMQELAGSVGLEIDALDIDSAAEFMNHPNPDHRLAALAALSRSARTPEVHSWRVRRLIQVIGPREAAKVVGGPRSPSSGLADGVQDTDALAARVWHMVNLDPDSRVRAAAVQAIGFLYFGSADVAIERRLAEIAVDSEHPDYMRFFACDALARVRGRPVSEWPVYRMSKRSNEDLAAVGAFFTCQAIHGVDWEANIDWRFVDECARE